MMVPVRCFTCGTVVGHNWDEYRERTARGENAGEVLTNLGLTRVLLPTDAADPRRPLGRGRPVRVERLSRGLAPHRRATEENGGPNGRVRPWKREAGKGSSRLEGGADYASSSSSASSFDLSLESLPLRS